MLNDTATNLGFDEVSEIPVDGLVAQVCIVPRNVDSEELQKIGQEVVSKGGTITSRFSHGSEWRDYNFYKLFSFLEQDQNGLALTVKCYGNLHRDNPIRLFDAALGAFGVQMKPESPAEHRHYVRRVEWDKMSEKLDRFYDKIGESTKKTAGKIPILHLSGPAAAAGSVVAFPFMIAGKGIVSAGQEIGSAWGKYVASPVEQHRKEKRIVKQVNRDATNMRNREYARRLESALRRLELRENMAFRDSCFTVILPEFLRQVEEEAEQAAAEWKERELKGYGIE